MTASGRLAGWYRRAPMPRLLVRVLLVASLLTALGASPARADYRDLIRDACRQDERVDGTYSQKDYREALDNLSDDQLQYTDCEAVIRAAQLAAARAQAGGSRAAAPGIENLIAGAGGDPLADATPQERAAVASAIDKAEESGGEPINVGGEVIDPGELGAGREVAASASDLPAPLLIALVIAALAAVATLVSAVAKRVRASRQS